MKTFLIIDQLQIEGRLLQLKYFTIVKREYILFGGFLHFSAHCDTLNNGIFSFIAFHYKNYIVKL